MNKDIIKEIIGTFDPFSKDYEIFVVANISKVINSYDDFINHTNDSEFFHKCEFANILSAITELFGYVRPFYSELELIKYILENISTINTQNALLFNFSRDGIYEGKKSLIPSFCNLFSIPYTGSNPFVISLLRNKFVYSKFLEANKIPVPKTINPSCEKNLDLDNLFNSKTIILKSISEAASVFMSEKNIIDLNTISQAEKLFLLNSIKSKKIIIQEFIEGLECEVFVIKYKNKYIAMDPIGININNAQIITYDISEKYDYDFYVLSDKLKISIVNKIKAISERCAMLLNVDGYVRFDFRVDKEGMPYLIDIAGSPYLIKHSSVAFLFKEMQLNYSDIFKLITMLSLK